MIWLYGPYTVAAAYTVPAAGMLFWGLGRLQDKRTGSGSALVLAGLCLLAAGYMAAMRSFGL